MLCKVRHAPFYSASIAGSGKGITRWVANKNNTSIVPTISTNRTVVMVPGPVRAKIWPISQERNILPAPDPTRNQPVIAPVICIRSPASIKMVGKMDAMDIPSPIVPIHKARLESFHSIITMVLIAQPIKSIIRMVCDRVRVETQTPSNLPIVNDPQKAEVR